MRDWSGLINYLETHQNGSAQQKDPLHERFLHIIKSCLPAIGVWGAERVYEDIVLLETNIYDEQFTLGQVDLAAVKDQSRLYLIEIKVLRGNGNKNNRKTIRTGLRRQLRKEYTFFAEHFDVCADRIGVYRREGYSMWDAFKIPVPEEDRIAMREGIVW